MKEPVRIVEVDLENEKHQADVGRLTAAYARDPMGKDGALSEAVLARLIAGLKATPTTLIFVAYF